MRTAAWIPISLALGVLAASACGDRQEPLGVPDLAPLNSSADAGAASAPSEFEFSFTFDDVNPCSGLVHTVTIAGTVRVHEHNGRVVGQERRTISTSSGFSGRGTASFVFNGQVERITVNDMLTHDSGDRIRPHFVLLVDVSTSTVRVQKGGLTCVGRPR